MSQDGGGHLTAVTEERDSASVRFNPRRRLMYAFVASRSCRFDTELAMMHTLSGTSVQIPSSLIASINTCKAGVASPTPRRMLMNQLRTSSAARWRRRSHAR